MAGETIFVVEDEVIFAINLQRILGNLGYTVPKPAQTGRDAVARALELKPDLILMDIYLAGDMDGIQAAEQIHATLDVPIIYVTAMTDEVYLKQAVATQPYGYLIKPVTEVDIRATVATALFRHRTDQLIKQSEERYRLLFNGMFNGFTLQEVVYDQDNQPVDYLFLDVNPAFEQITGWKASDVIGKTLRQVYADVDPQTLDVLEKVASTGDPIHFQVNLRKDNRTLEITTFRPAPNQCASFISDITEKVTAQNLINQRLRELAALNKAAQALSSTLSLQEVLAHVTNEARALLNTEAANVLLYNESTGNLTFAAVSGITAGKVERMEIPIEGSLVGWAYTTGEPLLVSDAASDPRYYGEIDRQTGFSIQSMLVAPMRYQERTLGVIVAANRPENQFTEHELDLLGILASSAAIAIQNARLYEAEQAQRQLVEKSQHMLVQSEKLAAMGRLAVSIAHEINNPLQALRSGFRLLLGPNVSPKKQKQYLQVVNREMERLVGIVDRVLGFYRPSQEMFTWVQLNQVLEDTLALANKGLENAHVKVVRCFDLELPLVRAVPDQLHQVFLNLVINALQFMPDGGILTIQTRHDPHTGWVQVLFTDTGAGIAPEAIENIFEPFFTTRQEGTGIGLTISYSIIERHGGRIEVASQPGCGAVFTVSLPFCENQQET